MATNPQQSTHHKTEITDRRQKVAEMYLSGRYQHDIADELGVNQATISRDLAELRKEWLERSINNYDQKKAIELAKLDRLEVTYWEAWERSKEDAEITITEQTGRRQKGSTGDSDEPVIVSDHIKRTKRIEGQVGNPAFLAGIQTCINKRCEILGLYAPIRSELTGLGNGPIIIKVTDKPDDS